MTEQQIVDHALPPAPDGKHDYQLEALAPDEIAAILHDAIRAQIDGAAYERIKQQERVDREDLRALYGV